MPGVVPEVDPVPLNHLPFGGGRPLLVERVEVARADVFLDRQQLFFVVSRRPQRSSRFSPERVAFFGYRWQSNPRPLVAAFVLFENPPNKVIFMPAGRNNDHCAVGFKTSKRG